VDSPIGELAVTAVPVAVALFLAGWWPIRYRYEDVVVFAEDARRRVLLLDEWPPELPPLPPGAAYSPRARLRGSTPPSRLSILPTLTPR
jgi:hypothetical protein